MNRGRGKQRRCGDTCLSQSPHVQFLFLSVTEADPDLTSVLSERIRIFFTRGLPSKQFNKMVISISGSDSNTWKIWRY